jgi:hypothetical protein
MDGFGENAIVNELCTVRPGVANRDHAYDRG